MAVVQRSPLWEADPQESAVVARASTWLGYGAHFSSIILIQLLLGRHYVGVVNSCHLSSF